MRSGHFVPDGTPKHRQLSKKNSDITLTATVTKSALPAMDSIKQKYQSVREEGVRNKFNSVREEGIRNKAVSITYPAHPSPKYISLHFPPAYSL